MKSTLTLLFLILCLSGLSSCDSIEHTKVEQIATHVKNVDDSPCVCHTELATYVWYKDEIVKSWYDNFEKMDSAKISDRKKEAELFLKKYKLVNQ